MIPLNKRTVRLSASKWQSLRIPVALPFVMVFALSPKMRLIKASHINQSNCIFFSLLMCLRMNWSETVAGLVYISYIFAQRIKRLWVFIVMKQLDSIRRKIFKNSVIKTLLAEFSLQ